MRGSGLAPKPESQPAAKVEQIEDVVLGERGFEPAD